MTSSEASWLGAIYFFHAAVFFFCLSVSILCEKLAPNKEPDTGLCWALVWPCASEKLVSQALSLSPCFFVAVSTRRGRFMTFPRTGHEETQISLADTKRMSYRVRAVSFFFLFFLRLVTYIVVACEWQEAN